MNTDKKDLIIKDKDEDGDKDEGICNKSPFTKIKNLFKKKPEKKESLDMVVSSIYEAVLKAQKSIQLNNINRLEYYFQIDEEGNFYKPKTLKMQLPSKEHAGNDIIEIPLFALVHHHSLNISEFTVKLKANIGGVDRNTEEGKLNLNNLHKNNYNFSTNITKIKGNTADIELKCRIEDPPDFIARMVNRFDRLL